MKDTNIQAHHFSLAATRKETSNDGGTKPSPLIRPPSQELRQISSSVNLINPETRGEEHLSKHDAELHGVAQAIILPPTQIGPTAINKEKGDQSNKSLFNFNLVDDHQTFDNKSMASVDGSSGGTFGCCSNWSSDTVCSFVSKFEDVPNRIFHFWKKEISGRLLFSHKAPLARRRNPKLVKTNSGLIVLSHGDSFSSSVSSLDDSSITEISTSTPKKKSRPTFFEAVYNVLYGRRSS